MNLQSFRPAKDFAIRYGFKTVVYGPPGSGKTPVLNSAPRPMLLATEPGLLSMRSSTVPTFPAFNSAAIDEFFKWLFHSNETKNFDTVGIDSVSQMCEIYLQDAMSGKTKSGNKAHGLAAYGEMAKNVMDNLRGLYYLQEKHTYLISKQENNNGYKRPYYPGQMLPTDIPHLYDAILNLDVHNVPSVGQVSSFQCQATIDIMARDRTGMLAIFEQPNFGALVQKAMA